MISEKQRLHMDKIHKLRIGTKLSKETKDKIGMASRNRYCSPETREKKRILSTGRRHSSETKLKMSIGRMGSKNPSWMGGLKEVGSRIRNSVKYFDWRQSVYIRDDFTCQKCCQRGGVLNAHHIKRFSVLLEEVKRNLPLIDLFDASMLYSPFWDISNGITLCEKCHNETKRKI